LLQHKVNIQYSHVLSWLELAPQNIQDASKDIAIILQKCSFEMNLLRKADSIFKYYTFIKEIILMLRVILVILRLLILLIRREIKIVTKQKPI